MYSQSCVTERLACKGSGSSLPPSIFFFFQQPEAFPLWACDLPKGSNSSGSHNHSLSLCKCASEHLDSCRPQALKRFHLVAACEKTGQAQRPLWACRNWPSFPGTKVTLGEPQSNPNDQDPKDIRRTNTLRWPSACSKCALGYRPGRKVKCYRVSAQSRYRDSRPFQKLDESYRNGLSSIRRPLALVTHQYRWERKMGKRCDQISWQLILTSSSQCARHLTISKTPKGR